ncbi:MAG: response regulator [Acetobacteraceae bacterium]|nr:response regulator [Acetobacteraceae bacterium]
MAVNQVSRILIVEDEPLIGLMLEEVLLNAGFEIAGLATKLEPALAIIASGACDVAILDANLAGESSAPAAVALTARGVPFVVLSGYNAEQRDKAFAGALSLKKPIKPETLIAALRNILPAQ